MISTFKTANLPIHIQSLGIILIIAGLWNIFYNPIIGIVVILISAPFLLVHYGVAIDNKEYKLKEYFNILGIKLGQWKDIDNAQAVQIIEVDESQRMWVSSISRTSYKKTYKLYLSLEDEHIFIMSGSKKKLMTYAEKLCTLLKVELIDKS